MGNLWAKSRSSFSEAGSWEWSISRCWEGITATQVAVGGQHPGPHPQAAFAPWSTGKGGSYKSQVVDIMPLHSIKIGNPHSPNADVRITFQTGAGTWRVGHGEFDCGNRGRDGHLPGPP